MLRSKIKYAVLGTVITSTLLVQPFFVKAVSADKSITDPDKSWTIKFNQYVGFDDETKNAITVTDSKGNVVSTNIKLLDNNKIEVDAPEGGYKQGEIYTLSIGNKVHSVGSRYLKNDAKYTFQLSPASQDYNYKSQVENALNTTVDRILKDGIEDDWQAFVVYKHGKEVPSSYLTSLQNSLSSAKADSLDPTDYERMTIVLSSIGQDPTNFGGYNLVEKIYNNTNMDNQGVNAYIFGLIALDSGNFDVPDNALLNKDKLIDKIISSKTTDNGWSIISDKAADTDMTAMVLTALAPYRNRQDVKQIVDNGIEKLSSMQDSDGGYSSMGTENSQSLSQVIIALCSNGVDPAGSEFTKNGRNLMDLLLSYQVDGGFSFDRKTGYDSLSTEQAAEALEAYKLFKEQAIGIYVSK